MAKAHGVREFKPCQTNNINCILNPISTGVGRGVGGGVRYSVCSNELTTLKHLSIPMFIGTQCTSYTT